MIARIKMTEKIKNEVVIVILLISVIGAFHIFTMRDGHGWSEDFALYILQAKSISEGIDHRETDFIWNPRSIGIPSSFPPGLPILLSPVYKFFGMNLHAMKIEILSVFLLLLFFAFWAFRSELPLEYCVCLIIIIGFNSYLGHYAGTIRAEIPLSLFTLSSLFFMHESCERGERNRLRSWYVICACLCVLFAFAMKSVGVLLIPLLVASFIVCQRKIRPIVVLLVALLSLLSLWLTVIQTPTLSQYAGFADRINPSHIWGVILRLPEIVSSYGAIWYRQFGTIDQHLLFTIMSCLALVGFVTRIKGGITVYEVFFVLHTGLIVTLKGGNPRYTIPVVPLYMFYSILGTYIVLSYMEKRFKTRRLRRTGLFLLMAAILLSYIRTYSKEDSLYPNREGISKKESIELFDYIRNNTNIDDVIVFRKAPVLTLLTGRRSSPYHKPGPGESLMTYFSEINATHIVLFPLVDNTWKAWPELPLFVESNKKWFQEVFANKDFTVYKIIAYP